MSLLHVKIAVKRVQHIVILQDRFKELRMKRLSVSRILMIL